MDFMIWLTNTVPKELLIILKSVTNREKDFEDIESIVKTDKNIDWGFIVDKAIRMRKNNRWILIDLEENMKKLGKKKHSSNKSTLTTEDEFSR